MPKFALANLLYQGQLPSQFHDLTWVEEMVCSQFQYTAHIARLFQSNGPALPNVVHGNTCTHDMNVVSTASVLPHTPANINGMVSFIFIGLGKLRPEFHKSMYQIQKEKVWEYLLWITTHNVHYLNMPLDCDILDQYPDNGAVSGMLLKTTYQMFHISFLKRLVGQLSILQNY